MNDENRVLDAKVVQLDRAKSTQGYKFQTAAEMSAMTVKKGITTKQRHYETRMALKNKGLVREYAGKWIASV
jgi:hypothetical protein